MAFEPGEIFDRYVIEDLLGEGGMGTVYRAFDPRLQRRVALKVLRTDRPDPDGASARRAARSTPEEHATEADARMMREARAAAALEHANCVAIFDVAEHQGVRFIAMEYIDGSPLRRFVGDTSVPLDQRVRWLVDVARALSAAHKRGLIHRDVKPENVMVRNDGTIKVLDFGIAKRATLGEAAAATAPAHEPTTLAAEMALAETAAGVVSGTPLYMAPEQLRQGALDARADQFSWGLMAYELLTGTHPFRKEGEGTQFVLGILHEEAVPPSLLVPHLPAVVQATVMKALAKGPSARFASMDQVVSALEPFGGASSARGLTGLAQVSNAESVKTELAMPVNARRSKPPERSRRAAIGVALGAVGALALAIAARGKTPAGAAADGDAASASVMATKDDASQGLAMTRAEAPKSKSEGALAAYAEGLQSFRAASFEAARQAFARAVQLDPALASGHLRIALLDSLVASETEARQAFRHAIEFRAALPDRDALLLDAFEPYLSREPSDLRECTRRLTGAVAKRPEDAELRLYLGTVQFDAGDVKAAEATFDRAIELDPEFAEAWSYRGATEAFRGELEVALASLDQCLAVSSGATDCLWYRVLVHDDRGECDKVEADARTWIAKAPDDSYAYHTLARALFARGLGEGPVRAALEQAWARIDAPSRERARVEDLLKLDVLAGDFTRAMSRGAELEKALAAEPSASAHGRLASFLVDANEEIGRPGEAGRVAADFLDRKEAWVAPSRVDDIAISTDLTPRMLAAQAAAGRITVSELASRRTTWLQTWAAKTSPAYLGHLWVYGYAASALGAEDARDALSALPRYEPLPAFQSASLAPGVAIGRVFLLAGHARQAVAHLARASRSCLMLDEPVSHVRASLYLGRAHEEMGARDEACAAYANVAKRWGAAKPRSKSGEEARAAMARLGCGR